MQSAALLTYETPLAPEEIRVQQADGALVIRVGRATNVQTHFDLAEFFCMLASWIGVGFCVAYWFGVRNAIAFAVMATYPGYLFLKQTIRSQRSARQSRLISVSAVNGISIRREGEMEPLHHWSREQILSIRVRDILSFPQSPKWQYSELTAKIAAHGWKQVLIGKRAAVNAVSSEVAGELGMVLESGTLIAIGSSLDA